MITLISATDKNGLIGNNGKLPWKIPEDMNFFKQVTTNNIVLMGRKTYISIGQPLSKRVNVIISSSLVENFNPEKNIEEYNSDVIILNSFEHVLDEYFSKKNLYIIGGRSIYKQTLDNLIPDKLYISRIDGEYEGNEYMPEIPSVYKVFQTFKISDRVTVWEYRK